MNPTILKETPMEHPTATPTLLIALNVHCPSDMYPYKMLPESIKDYDRVTVDTVLKAISELSQGGN